jgi:hypothetical protein
MTCVETVDCSTSDEFLSAITLSGPPPRKLGYDFILFRGVANGFGSGEYKLVPSALRQDNFISLSRLAGSSCRDEDAEAEWVQGRFEADVIGSFFRFADMQGLAVPEVGIGLRQTMQLRSTSEALFNTAILTGGVWPPDNLLSMIGLAQHYGLPTRLLDWSRDALTAAYFAATGALRRVQRGESMHAVENRLAVWIFNAELLDFKQRLVLSHSQKLPNIPVAFVTAPAASNPNLRAQQGVFTVWRPQMSNRQHQQVDRRPLDELIDECLERDGVELPSLSLFYKVTLPLAEAPALLHLLLRTGVTAARLFPGYEGAAEAVREWSRRQPVDWPWRPFEVSYDKGKDRFDTDLLTACLQYVTRGNPGSEHESVEAALQDIRSRLSVFAENLDIRERGDKLYT